MRCRLFIDPPAEGAWNMAVDEALLDDAADRGLASLRFYRWREPTLSLGYFQRYDEREQHAPSHRAPVVRRLSGGGALIHDRELTYSLCLPGSHPLAREAVTLYELAHEELIKILAERGIAASLCGDATTAVPSSDERDKHFLCFARRTTADVVLEPSATTGPTPPKIVGSAQRRRRGAVLQHGAVLLETSPAAPELPGLDGAGAPHLDANELVVPWSERLAALLNLRLERTDFAATSALQSCKEYYEKHVSEAWIARR